MGGRRPDETPEEYRTRRRGYYLAEKARNPEGVKAREQAAKRRYYETHHDQELVRMAQWREANRELARQISRDSRRKGRATDPEAERAYLWAYKRRIREEVLTAYGGVCACCGESTFEFLSLDHINGGGTKERKATGRVGYKLCNWLRREGYPPGFRVLCHNCNQAIGYYGVCPHQAATNSPSEESGIQ